MNARVISISIVFICVLAATVLAQDTIGSGEVTATPDQQLMELESKETHLKIRLEELDEQLRPENIEIAVAGIGSLHPEVLREDRRKRLTIERDGIITQLDLLEDNRARIKAAIVAAEYAAYLKYALPSPTPAPVTSPCTTTIEEARTVTGTLKGAIIAISSEAQPYKVAGAKLKLKGMLLIEASSSEQGEYEFTCLSNGDYTLEVSAPGFKTFSKLVTVQAGEVLIENITLEVGEQ
jgi:Carboxypeptidase regulatory-like domain